MTQRGKNGINLDMRAASQGAMPELLRLERAIMSLPIAAWRIKLMEQNSAQGLNFQKRKSTEHHDGRNN